MKKFVWQIFSHTDSGTCHWWPAIVTPPHADGSTLTPPCYARRQTMSPAAAPPPNFATNFTMIFNWSTAIQINHPWIHSHFISHSINKIFSKWIFVFSSSIWYWCRYNCTLFAFNCIPSPNCLRLVCCWNLSVCVWSSSIWSGMQSVASAMKQWKRPVTFWTF